jgi:uncharacterized protein
MKNSKELLIQFLTSFRTPEEAAELFADDGVLELPYLETLNFPHRSVGPKEIGPYLRTLLNLVPDWEFVNIQVMIETPEQVFAEYEVHASTAGTNRKFDQHFYGRLVAKNGKIILLREALNLVVTARALFPNGLADIPAALV